MFPGNPRGNVRNERAIDKDSDLNPSDDIYPQLGGREEPPISDAGQHARARSLKSRNIIPSLFATRNQLLSWVTNGGSLRPTFAGQLWMISAENLMPVNSLPSYHCLSGPAVGATFRWKLLLLPVNYMTGETSTIIDWSIGILLRGASQYGIVHAPVLQCYAGDWAETYDVYIHYGKIRCHYKLISTERRIFTYLRKFTPEIPFRSRFPLSFISELWPGLDANYHTGIEAVM